jgi:hypothetical protein|tara:strand:+ start:98 stop:559 length:462 start_codon:yes stop_codon:yes gene_type:complete
MFASMSAPKEASRSNTVNKGTTSLWGGATAEKEATLASRHAVSPSSKAQRPTQLWGYDASSCAAAAAGGRVVQPQPANRAAAAPYGNEASAPQGSSAVPTGATTAAPFATTAASPLRAAIDQGPPPIIADLTQDQDARAAANKRKAAGTGSLW